MTLTIAKTKYEHIVLDEKGIPIVAGTNMKVIELVLEKTLMAGARKNFIFSILT